MSIYLNLFIYLTYIVFVVWTVINYRLFIRKNVIDSLVIVAILIYLFPAYGVLIPLGLMFNYAVTLTSGMFMRAPK
jgi:hypothetical protein